MIWHSRSCLSQYSKTIWDCASSMQLNSKDTEFAKDKIDDVMVLQF
jgi:hypothetical protein